MYTRVAAVVNAGESISGRYPNGGPIRVVQAGIPLVDRAGEDVLDRLHEGEQIRVDGAEIWRGNEVIATGDPLSAEEIQAAMDAARKMQGVSPAKNRIETSFARKNAFEIAAGIAIPGLG